MRRRCASIGACVVALLMFNALSACALPLVGASTAKAVGVKPAAPAGWTIYHGAHFSIAYPAGWSSATPTFAGDGQSVVVILSGPQPRDQIEVVETSGIPQAQIPDVCAATGQSPAHLAGLPMTYTVAEGVHRVWSFFSAAHISYQVSAMDADQPAAMQAQHNTILATFQPDDTTPGCP